MKKNYKILIVKKINNNFKTTILYFKYKIVAENKFRNINKNYFINEKYEEINIFLENKKGKILDGKKLWKI